jgi:hypothetical protein
MKWRLRQPRMKMPFPVSVAANRSRRFTIRALLNSRKAAGNALHAGKCEKNYQTVRAE